MPHEKDEIKIEIAHSSLGLVLVAISRTGIRAVQLGDDAGALHEELKNRFPQSAIAESDSATKAIADNVVAFIESGNREDLGAELDVRGTEFQRSVWTALQQIPRGSTLSYSQLAAKIGKPAAVRAVAHACAENALAVIIPCHRAVRSDGSLAGYRWGLDRKKALLAREAEQSLVTLGA